MVFFQKYPTMPPHHGRFSFFENTLFFGPPCIFWIIIYIAYSMNNFPSTFNCGIQKYKELSVDICHHSMASLFRESWGSCLAPSDRSSSRGATLRWARWRSSSLSSSLTSLSLSLYNYDCRWWTWWRWWTAWSTSSSTAPCPGSSAPPSGQ